MDLLDVSKSSTLFGDESVEEEIVEWLSSLSNGTNSWNEPGE